MNLEILSSVTIEELQTVVDNKLFRSVLDAMPNGVQVLKALRSEQNEITDFICMFANGAAENYFGKKITGKKFSSFFYNADRPFFFEKLINVVSSRITEKFIHHPSEDRMQKWFHYTINKFGDGVMIMQEDVSENKKSEQEIKEQAHFISQITETVPDMISVMEFPSRKFTYVNKETFKLQGFDIEMMSKLSGEELREIIYEDDRTALDNYFNSLSTAGDDEIITADYRAKNFKSNWLWFKVRGVVFQRDDSGKVTHILNIIQNITEQKIAEEKITGLNKELSTKNRELETANSELRTFSSVAASDYKETLKHLYTLLEFVATNDARSFSNAGKANVRRAQSAIQKLKLLTDDILSYTQIHPAEAEIATVNLNDILKTALQKLNRRIEETDASIRFEKLPQIKGYSNLLLLLFYHLLDNAIKFRKEKGKAVIQIKYSQATGMNINHADADPTTAYHVISVTDNGIGVEKIHLEKIFQMFYIAHERGKYKGSGIGLAICKKVMDIHDGFITAEYTPELSGTTFNCFFPLQKSPPN